MDPRLKHYKRLKKSGRIPKKKSKINSRKERREKDAPTVYGFWGHFGAGLPYTIWGYIIGYAIGTFIVGYFIVWPAIKYFLIPLWTIMAHSLGLHYLYEAYFE